MEITLSRQCFTQALARTTNIADKKSSMPILSNVLIKTQDSGSVLFATTDLKLSASGFFPATVAEEGEITLPARMLFDIVKSMPDGNITLSTEEDSAKITGGRSKFKIMGLLAQDFPVIPDASDVNFFEIESNILKSMINKTAFSISSDDSRPHLNGAFFVGDGKILRMVTTDGHRLSKAEYKVDQSGFYNFSMVIPHRGIQEIKNLLDEEENKVYIGSHEGSVFIKYSVEIEKANEETPARRADLLLVSKLIESEFPPYDKVIPVNHEKKIILPKKILLDALKRVSVVSSDRTLGVKIVLSPGIMEIHTDNPSIGEGMEMVDIDYSDEKVEIGFNAKYFIEVLSALDDEELKLEFSGALDPGVVKDLDDHFVGVVMPLRI